MNFTMAGRQAINDDNNYAMLLIKIPPVSKLHRIF